MQEYINYYRLPLSLLQHYPIDLRQKILSVWQNQEGSQREIAKRFKFSLSFVRDFLRRYRETKEIDSRFFELSAITTFRDTFALGDPQSGGGS